MAARWKFLIALWTVYLVWGSTYVAIKISVRTLPAFLSAGLALSARGRGAGADPDSERPQHPGHAPGARVLGTARPRAARARCGRRDARRDTNRLEHGRDDRRHGAAAGDRAAHPGARAGRTRHEAERPRRARRARTDRDPRHRRLLQCDRPRADGRLRPSRGRSARSSPTGCRCRRTASSRRPGRC